MAGLWTIKPLCLGELPSYEKSWLTYMVDPGVKIRIPVVAWVLQSDAGTIIVDTGPPAPAIANQFHTHFEQLPDQVPQAALRAAGVQPSLVELVILTHLHWDHCYNAELFPRARFVVQRRELNAALDPVSTQRMTYEWGIPGHQPPWISVLDRLEVISGAAQVAPGVSVIPLPGHTMGLQGVLVETSGGRHLIASDAIPSYDNLGTDKSDPVPPGFLIDVSACLHSLAKAREIADVVLPGHDLRVLRHLTYPLDSHRESLP